MNLDTAKLQILSEHYTHTFDFLQSHLKKRDRLFIGVLLLIIVMLFQIYTPDETSSVITQLISTKLDLKTPINFLYVQSVIWFVLLAIVIKYFQSIVFIERQYGYIHALENILSSQYGDGAFTREGDSYLNEYPVFLNWASFLYTILFPTILVVVITSKIISEYKQYGIGEILIWFNFLIFIFISISIALYLYVIHFKKKKRP
jgi:hypothetical protein